jgi:hypothetical protein
LTQDDPHSPGSTPANKGSGNVRKQPAKPAGLKASIRVGAMGAQLQPLILPSKKDVREKLIAELFVGSIAKVPDPLNPFSDLIQNSENDLDFTVTTSRGLRKFDLIEFASLQAFAGKYANAPADTNAGQLADLACDCIASKMYGSSNHLLVVYVTDAAFHIDPPVEEIIRRQLETNPPASLERVYFLPMTNMSGAIEAPFVFTLYPAKPHYQFGTWNLQELRAGTIQRPFAPRSFLSGSAAPVVKRPRR